MKRLVDLLIVVLLAAVLGIGGYFAYTEFLAEDDTTDSSVGPQASTSDGEMVELPRLSTAQLTDVLPTVADLPPELAGASGGEVQTVDLNANAAVVSLAEDRDAVSRFTDIRSTYNWASAARVEFDTFTLNQSTSFVRALVSQFPSTQQARNFIDDPLVRGYYAALRYDVQPVDDLHGWLLTSENPVEGTGYAKERQTLLFFDHLGLVVMLQANTDATADPMLGKNIVLAMAPDVLRNIRELNALDAVTIPPTPTPQAITATLLTAGIRTNDLDRLVPAPRRWDLNVLYDLSTEDSAEYTLTDLIAFYQGLGTPALDQLAAAIDRAGRRYGLIAQLVRVWRPETNCPVDAPVRMELDLSLFERPAGADAYMRDAALQDAWRNTGVFSEFQPTGDGVFAFGSVNHACGSMQVVQKSVTYERLLYTLSMTVPAATDQQAVMDQIDAILTDTLNDLYMEQLR